MQLYIIHLFLQNALYVSGGSYAHQQELKTVHAASGFFKPILLPATSVEEFQFSTLAAGSSISLKEKNPMLHVQF
jgi:hypothetical protein